MSNEVSLNDLDAVASCDTPFEFQVVSPKTGKPMDVFISVIGDQSDRVKQHARQATNKARLAEATRKIEDRVITIEEDEQFSVETCVLRTVGWRGIKEPFTAENARTLYTKNVMIRAQVLRHSSNIANFIKL
jgi:hypothetical protein